MRTIYINLLAIITIIPNMHGVEDAQHTDATSNTGYSIMNNIAPIIEAVAIESAGYYISHSEHPEYAILTGSGAMFIIGYLRSIYNTYSEKELITKLLQFCANFMAALPCEQVLVDDNVQRSKIQELKKLQGHPKLNVNEPIPTNITWQEFHERRKRYKEYRNLEKECKNFSPMSDSWNARTESAMYTALTTPLLLISESIGAMCGAYNDNSCG